MLNSRGPNIEPCGTAAGYPLPFTKILIHYYCSLSVH